MITETRIFGKFCSVLYDTTIFWGGFQGHSFQLQGDTPALFCNQNFVILMGTSDGDERGRDCEVVGRSGLGCDGVGRGRDY